VQGANLVTTDGTGLRTGQLAIYDPFGDPINVTTGADGTTTADSQVPTNTTTPGVTYGWEGSHEKPYVNVGGITTIEMGARQYVPILGRFLSNDSVNFSDVSGQRFRGRHSGLLKTVGVPYPHLHHLDLSWGDKKKFRLLNSKFFQEALIYFMERQRYRSG